MDHPHQPLASSGGVPEAAGRLSREYDLVRLCRQAREIATRLGIDERDVRGLSAASFEAARVLRAAGAAARLELSLREGPSVHVTFHGIAPAETIQTLASSLSSFSDVVPGLNLTCEPESAVVRIGLSSAGTRPAQLSSIHGLLPDGVDTLASQDSASSDEDGAVADDPPAVAELQTELEELHHAIASLYVELAAQHRELRAAAAERDELEEELRRRAGDRVAANRAIEDFLSTLSHELRTPLNAMLGWARLLRMGQLYGAEAARALDALERNAQLQAQLISDILDASRIVTGNLQLEPHPVRVGAVIGAAIDAVRTEADAKHITVEAAVRFRGRVVGDADRLDQVVRNLLANAIKFTPDGGRIRVSLERRRQLILLTVSDTGEGIDQAFLPFVFERFRQGDTSATRTHGGLGLGLSIVRHLVELHGGRVEVASEGPGLGASFMVYLPVAGAESPDSA